MYIGVECLTSVYVDTQGLQCSSFLVMTYFLLRDYNILPKKELPLSPWIPWRLGRTMMSRTPLLYNWALAAFTLLTCDHSLKESKVPKYRAYLGVSALGIAMLLSSRRLVVECYLDPKSMSNNGL